MRRLASSDLLSNPRGSAGYGQKHLSAIRHGWGGVDYQDIMAAADHAAHLPWVDAERMGIPGGSYGGYMTNWVVTHTDRFKVAVAMRSTCNRMSQFGASDAAFMNGDFEFDGCPIEQGNTGSRGWGTSWPGSSGT